MKRILIPIVLFSLSLISVEACQFNTQCGFGAACIKPRGSLFGYCAGGMQPGNSHDQRPAYNPLDVSKKQGTTCSFDLDCGVGHSCAKSPGAIYGVCI